MQTVGRDAYYAIVNADGSFYSRVGASTGFSPDLNAAILYHDPKQAVAKMNQLGLQRSNIHKVLVSRVVVKTIEHEYPWTKNVKPTTETIRKHPSMKDVRAIIFND